MDKQSPSFVKTAVNWISRSKLSVFGGVLLSVVTPVLLVAVIFDIQGAVQNPYFGFLIYMILGPLFLFGLLLILVGSILSRGKEDIGLFTLEYIEEQLTRPGRYSRIRRHLLLTVSLTVIILFSVSLVSYTGFHFTESTDFCGQFCHQVMEPAYSTYQNSPHSRIACVDCHFGDNWTFQSKFSGVKQLFAVMSDSYPRPIKQPSTSLRPERQTCEQCHRPEMLHGDELRIKNHYLPDADNSHVQTVLLMKIGSGGYQGDKAHGIHWHVAEEQKVTYRHADFEQEEIVQVWLENGEEHVLFEKGSAVTEEVNGVKGEVRSMDCMDCHNRPTHVFLSADEALDEKIHAGVISSTIPYIKRQAHEVISAEFDSVNIAMLTISQRLRQWYQEKYPDFTDNEKKLLDSSIEGIQQAYRENVFPDMNVGWGTYKSFIGHKNGTGCFRCHGGEHASSTGQKISNDCDLCHIILAEKEPSPDVLRILQGKSQ